MSDTPVPEAIPSILPPALALKKVTMKFEAITDWFAIAAATTMALTGHISGEIALAFIGILAGVAQTLRHKGRGGSAIIFLASGPAIKMALAAMGKPVS